MEATDLTNDEYTGTFPIRCADATHPLNCPCGLDPVPPKSKTPPLDAKTSSQVSLRLIFPSELDRDEFLVWLADGGGEYDFMEGADTSVNYFDYTKAFPAWGYNSNVDGEPVVVLKSIKEESEQ